MQSKQQAFDQNRHDFENSHSGKSCLFVE